jgi:hypothetical protein
MCTVLGISAAMNTCPAESAPIIGLKALTTQRPAMSRTECSKRQAQHRPPKELLLVLHNTLHCNLSANMRARTA